MWRSLLSCYICYLLFLFSMCFVNQNGHGVSFLQKVAASCVWLASKLEESPRKARQVIIVFQRMECRRENIPIEHLDLYSKVRSFLVSLCVHLIHRYKHMMIFFFFLFSIISCYLNILFFIFMSRNMLIWKWSWAEQRDIFLKKWGSFVM